MSGVKRSVVTAMLIAAGVVLPIVFHMIPAGVAARSLLPMHIPVLIAGLIVGPFYGFFAGLITPLFSSMITGMPVAGLTLYRMMVELSVYGAVAGLVMRHLRTKRMIVDVYVSLIAAMIVGRVAAGVFAAALLFGSGTFSVGVWVAGYFTTSVPGIVLQIVIIPIIVMSLEKARLVPVRYVAVGANCVRPIKN